MKVCCLLLVSVGLAAAQSLPMPGQVPSQTLPMPGQTPAPAQDNLRDDTIVAKVDGKDVTVAQVRELLRNESPPVIQRFLTDPTGIIGRLLMVRELVAEAEKAKIDQQSPLKEQLEQMRMQALATGMINYVSNSYRVSSEDIKAFYEANKSRYLQAKIKAVLVKFKPAVALTPGTAPSTEELAKIAVAAAHSSIQRSETDAQGRAMEVVHKLRDGADFAKVAADYSDDDVSKAAGGDFGMVTQASSYSDAIKKAVFALKIGEISDPLRENTGYYVIQVVDKTPQPMNELIEPITEEIRQSHVNQWFSQMTARFQPSIQNQDFFMHPGKAIGVSTPAAPAAATPAPASPVQK